jgi:predicted MFS family arabinose efflux permease
MLTVNERKLTARRDADEKEAGIYDEPDTADGDGNKTAANKSADDKSDGKEFIGTEPADNKTAANKFAANKSADDKTTAKKGSGQSFFHSIADNFAGLGKPQVRSLFFLLLSVFLWFFAYNAVRSWFSTASYDLLGSGNFGMPLMIANVAGFIMYFPSAIIADVIGRRNTVIIGLLLMTAGFAAASVFVFLIKSASVFTLLFDAVFMLVGAGWAALNVHSYVMSVELANRKNTGFFTGLYYVFSMAAQAITTVVSGFVLEQWGMTALFPYALIFTAAAIVTMCFVHHGNAQRVKMKHRENG